MGIGNLFRPKYKHSNPQVRARAIADLTADQSTIVVEIASTDDDTAVRKAAINHLSDPADLEEVAQAQNDSTLRRLAHGRAVDLWTKAALADDEDAARQAINGIVGADDQKALAEIAHRATSMDVRQLALASLQEPKALAELARNASSSAMRLSALARIDDAEVLRSIAIDEQRKPLAFAAIDRISDQDVLQHIAAKAKSKSARSRARKKAAANKPEPSAEKKASSSEQRRRHAERVQLVREVQWLSNSDEWVASFEKINAAKAQWAELGDAEADGDAKLDKKFHKAVTKYDRRRSVHADQIAKAEAKAKKQQEERERREAEAKAKQEQAEAQAAEPAAEQPAAEAHAAEAAPTEAEAAEPTDEPATDPAKDAERDKRKAERAEREREAVAKLEALCKDLDEGLSLNKLKPADRLLSRSKKTFDGLKLPASAKELTARFEEARNKLFIKVQELREADDWQRWANVPKCEALIKRAEALLADEEAKDLGKKLQDLQSEWKQSSALPKAKADALWESFKATCDKIYERVKVQRGHENEERKANLRKKEELCDQVEVLATSTDWAETAQKIKQLQAEWKTIGPAPRRQADAVWKRFRAACDKFFDARKPHLEASLADQTKNLEKKQKLMERAEALAESSDWGPTSAELRDMQKDWREIGHAPRKEGAEVAKRFRAACDKFFKRREDDKKAQREAEARKVQDIADEIEAVRKIAAGEAEGDDAWVDTNELVDRTLAIRTKYLALPERDQRDDVREALAKTCLLMVEAHADSFGDTELDPTVSRQRKEKLVARAEELAPKQEQAKAVVDETPEQVAERLRAALAENALGVGKDDDGAIAEIAELKSSWHRLGPVPGTIGTELEQRFRSACERTLATYQK